MSGTVCRGRGWRVGLLVLAALVLGHALPAQAQARVSGPSRFDASISGGLVTGASLGAADANLRSNANPPGPFPLFTTSTDLRPSAAFEARVAGAVHPRVSVEGQVAYARPELRTRVSADAESAPDTTVTARVQSLFAGGGVRLRLDDPARQRATMPHIVIGGGLLRYTDERGSVVDEAVAIHAGGGLRHALTRTPAGDARAGIRIDVQVLVSDALRDTGSGAARVMASGGVFIAF